ncbi:MAG: hypothetical protein J5I94_02690 [Phaeodactylibacter sp.]|nr:hypothetical protein [Phaeodactylibacter sp.]
MDAFDLGGENSFKSGRVANLMDAVDAFDLGGENSFEYFMHVLGELLWMPSIWEVRTASNFMPDVLDL